MKLTKKISLLTLALLLTMTFGNKVKAEGEVCKTYKNYYYFIVINKESEYETIYYGDELTGNVMITHTYFPSLPEGFKKNSAKSIAICIKRNDTDTSCTDGGKEPDEIWTLNEFYQKYRTVATSEKVIEYTSPKGDTSSKELISDNVRHYTHGKWLYEDGTVGGAGVSLSDSDIAAMSNASLLPEMVSITADADQSLANNTDWMMATISRTFKKDFANNSSVTAFNVAWSDGTTYPSILSPSAYGIEYQLCETAYEAEIEYFVKEDDGTLTPANKYDEDIVTYNKDELEDGYEENVPTPKLSGCTPDKDNVKVQIEGKDFYDRVIYTCKSNVPDNPKTGDFLIYIAWAVGLGAIGYSIYYFNKLKKENKGQI